MKLKDPRRFVAFDCEGDKGKFLGCAIAWVEGGELQNIYCTHREDAVRMLRYLGKSGMTGIAHNVAYDLGVLIPQPFGPEVSFRMVGSKVLDARLYELELWDSYGLCPQRLEDIGDWMMFPKLRPPWEPGGAPIADYCKRDALIVLELAHRFQVWARGHGANLTQRAAGLSTQLWPQYTAEPIPVLSEQPEWAYDALYGGRAEQFKPAQAYERVQVWDYNAMYPAVQAEGRFPDPRTGPHDQGGNFDPAALGVVDATVEQAGTLPVLPVKRDGGLYFPTGRFRGVWTMPEFTYALGRGVDIIEVHHQYTYDRWMSPFADFQQALWDERLAARRSDDRVTELFVKTVMASLWGRLGMKPGAIARLDHMSKWTPEPCGKCLGCRTGGICPKIQGARQLGQHWIHAMPAKAPKYLNAVWAAYTTAYGRIRLHRLMRAVRLGRLVSCHTDSITVVDGPEPRQVGPVRYGTGMGMLKLEYNGPAEVRGPSEYWRDEGSGFHISGVPASQAREFWQNRQAPIKRSLGIMNGLATGRVAEWVTDDFFAAKQRRSSRAEHGRRAWAIEEIERATE